MRVGFATATERFRRESASLGLSDDTAVHASSSVPIRILTDVWLLPASPWCRLSSFQSWSRASLCAPHVYFLDILVALTSLICTALNPCSGNSGNINRTAHT